MNDRTILIPHMQHFYTLMSSNEDIVFKDPTMAVIKDYLDAANTGCSCRKKQNEDKAFELYKILNEKVNMNVVNELKNILGAKELLFFQDNKHLFTL
jgi:hypothetical protein